MMKNDANLQELEEFCKNILNYINNEDIVRTIEN
jgi:regulator of sigma D